MMLEETKDTITVPAAFMIRMLACIHSLRNRRTNVRNGPDAADGADTSQNDGNAHQNPFNAPAEPGLGNEDDDNEID